jgi:hypothetical protein
MKTITVEFICSFNERSQQIINEDISEIKAQEILRSKEKLFNFATEDQLSEEEKQDLYKISTCFYGDLEDITPPDWYMECNGKLWIENGVLTD